MQPVRDSPRGATAQIKQTSRVAVATQRARTQAWQRASMRSQASALSCVLTHQDTEPASGARAARSQCFHVLFPIFIFVQPRV